MEDTQSAGISEFLTVCGVTPLYGFASDAERLEVGEIATIEAFKESMLQDFVAEDVLRQQLKLLPPNYVIRHRLTLPKSEVLRIYAPQDMSGRPGAMDGVGFISQLTSPVILFLRSLQLFKPGRLMAGDTAFFALGEKPWGTMMLVRCSESSPDYHHARTAGTLLELHENELPFLSGFLQLTARLLPLASAIPQLELALHKYCSESTSNGDVVDLTTCLEALLVQEDDGLNFRLALRCANLNGYTAAERKDIYGEIRKFYGVRSKFVHGEKLDPKHINTLGRIDRLRELTRRTLLAVLGILIDRGSLFDREFYAALDGMCLDDEERSSLQRAASRVLHFTGCGQE
jgi:hypothetical protein